MATAPVRSPASTSRIAAALSCAMCAGSRLTAATSPACSDREATTSTVRSDSSAARSAAINTLELLGSTTICSAATPWIAASSSEVDGLSFGPTSSVLTPSDEYSSLKPSPVTTASAPQVAPGRAPLPTPARTSPSVAGSSDSDRPPARRPVARPASRPARSCRRCRCGRPSATPANSAVAASGSSVWTWIFSVVRVADDQHRVAEPLELADEVPLVQFGRRSRRSWCSTGRCWMSARDG